MRRFPVREGRYRGGGLEGTPCVAWRLLRQQLQERALRRPQQERSYEPEQEHRVSGRAAHALHSAGNARRGRKPFQAEAKNGGARSWPRPDSPGRAYSNRPVPWARALGRGTLSCLFDALTSWENLLRAWRNASRGKRGQPNVAFFEHRLEDHLATLRTDLRARTYRPGTYRSFFIREPKRRLISAAPFRDRVVHHALCNVIEPLFERGFIFDTYANRRGKGTHRALTRCQELARHYHYVLQLDIRQFFPSIDHATLRRLLAAKISDPGVLWLADQILASGEGVLSEAYDMVYFPGDDLFAINRPRGLPIGNLTSQFWGNVYLNGLDHFVKRELRCPGYVRYVDDLLLFDRSKEALWRAKDAVVERLESLRLTVHPGAHPKPVEEGIPFLGFVNFPQRRRLKRRKGVQFQRKLRRSVAAFQAGELTEARLIASVQGWRAHVRYGNTAGLQQAILEKFPAEALATLGLPRGSSPPRGSPRLI